jgi:hypothetical protein
MKLVFIKREIIRYLLGIFVLVSISSCMSTKVIGSHHSDDLDNEECQKISHWKYWWGIGGSDEILVQADSEDTECPCVSNAIASIEVKSSLGDFLLNLITIGIVNHRTVSYECAETDEGEQ